MAPDDNTVNIESRPYHHGSLHGDLVEAGMRLLERPDAGGVGLREVARAVGVSATAVYRHFPNKEALLRAIAERGFEMMGAMQQKAARRAAPKAAFAAVGAAYVHFARAHPAVFRLMFASAPPCDPFSLPSEELSLPMRLLREHVGQLAPAGASEQHRRRTSIHAWSLVHGLAVLALDGMVQVDDADIEAIIAA